MSDIFARTRLLFGNEALRKLSEARVALFGVGGVGGYAAEALARSGIGAIDIIDNDTVAESNINRQIIALHSTVGMYKTDAAAARIHDINPDCKVTGHKIFFLPENKELLDFRQFDYVIDAIDTVSGKLAVIECARAAGVPVISSMGTGNKTNPSCLTIADIFETSVCPLARVMRHECRKRGIDKLKVVYSAEEPRTPQETETSANGKPVPGSTAFVPPTAGLLIASEVVRYLTEGAQNERS
ncbi:MAG: tRNA threonylcarbamoyladenosine dehydratase [Ruminiclostridium sp.]|nr:tRNA threonylcarbamoyladenosine dehydratase [Ruminiclostridium sp.]